MRTSDYRRIDVADVYRQGTLTGQIKRTDDGTEFTYDEKFLEERPLGDMGVSWTMPQSSLPYIGRGESLPPFFANLAPEGARLAATIGRLHTSPDDLMTVLLAIGTDCIGDVQVVPEGVEPVMERVIRPQSLKDADFEKLFFEAVGGDDLERVSIPGVQEKASGNVISFPAEVGFGKDPTIIKISPHSVPNLVENEAYFLSVARNAGIEVNDWKLVHDRTGRAGIVLARFDRVVDKSGLALVHQEDACQLLDRYPWQKYRITLKEVARAFKLFATSERRETLRLLRMYCLSYLIGNADLHAKNVSLYMKPGTGTVEMTPGYDLLSTLPYSMFDTRMAMAMDGKDDSFKPRQFEEFGERWDVPPKAVREMTIEVVDAVSSSISTLEEIGLDDKATKRMRSIMQERLQKFTHELR